MHWKGNINIFNSLPLLLFIGEKFTLWLVCFRYGTKFMDDYQDIMTKKLGLPKYNKQLIGKLLTNMAVDKVDYTNFFRTLSNIKADTSIPDDELLVPLKSVLLDIGQERKEAWTSWLKTYIYEV
jgi:serine/tyrosine/threonine adenylyltransferase